MCHKDGQQKSHTPHTKQTTLKEEKETRRKKLQNINIDKKKYRNDYSLLEDKKSLTPFLKLETLDA